MSIRALSFSFCLMSLFIILPAHATETKQEKKAPITKQNKQIKPKAPAKKNQPTEEAKPADEPEEAMTPPFVTNASITGDYYFAHENFIRDVYITTPINGKFYFRVFAAQTPIKNGMTIQYYNDVDGVATFTQKGMGVFRSPHGNCNLYFFFKPPKLIIQQELDCGMASELGLEPRGGYKQIESF